MVNRDLTDDEVEALLGGATVDGVPAGLTDLVGELRRAPLVTRAVPPSPALAEFVHVGELGPAPDLTNPQETSLMTKLGKRLATTTGRTAVIAAVILGTAGAAQAKGVVDVRHLAGFGPASSAVTAESTDHDTDGGVRHTITGGHGASSEAGHEATGEAEGQHPGDADDHGKQVSALATGTDLQGCEKGQAIAAVASAGAADHRQNDGNGNTNDPCDHRPDDGKPAPVTTATVPRPSLPGPTAPVCEKILFADAAGSAEANGRPATTAPRPMPPCTVPHTLSTLPPVTIPGNGNGNGNGGSDDGANNGNGHSTTITAPGPAATR